MARSNYPAAEQAYRRALQIDPQSAGAQNDLAYVLWAREQEQSLGEARALAESAIKAQPQEARFYDTLARILARGGDRDSATNAIKTFRIALSKDPNSLEALIGLADLLSHDPRERQEATDLLRKAGELLKSSPPIPPLVLKQYQSACQVLAISLLIARARQCARRRRPVDAMPPRRSRFYVVPSTINSRWHRNC